MRVRRLYINNYRGVRKGTVEFSGHTLMVGGNNIGKSTVCEALDLVLGPERLSRRPIVDEHDFYGGQYLDGEGKPVEIRVSALLLGLSPEAEKRFFKHLRRWNDATGTFADEGGGPEAGDAEGTCWALPVTFIARYDANQDDFVGNTFFEHPADARELDIEEEPENRLGDGRTKFTRESKRLCGYLFLHALRTGTRALSLQRGSLLDTVLRLPGNGLSAMWQDTLQKLRELDPAIGEIEQLKEISNEIRQRMAQFVNLTAGDKAAGFFASELTREHLREVVKLFLSVQPGDYLLPFQRLGTGSVNLLVFAMLTFIAELKGQASTIFAMEEPELALPPHTQRRVTRFVLGQMGQAIITSHSPYIIEQFEPSQIVVLNRTEDGELSGKPIDLCGLKPKKFVRERRQLAEAILARAVLVVEGATEAAIFAAASTVLENGVGPQAYNHFDIAGVSVFDAGGEGSAPAYGPFFKNLGKTAFCVTDKPNAEPDAAAKASLAEYHTYWESSDRSIETLLTNELSDTVLRRFLDSVKGRPDYPSQAGAVPEEMAEADVRRLAKDVLKHRKGNLYEYGSLLIAQCENADDLPKTVRGILEAIHGVLNPVGPVENGEVAQPMVAPEAAVQPEVSNVT